MIAVGSIRHNGEKQYSLIFSSIRPKQAFYTFIDANTTNSHFARIWAARRATGHTANQGMPNPIIAGWVLIGSPPGQI